ncbi:polysaccharide biosynthesis protein [Aestuariibaculum lutulentum]|uniref:Polysaccharide biosynthesis protein n=1 Tax=Aestuariibaculum lutulentum TaxID=2920935 RepID=A0ABS9RLM0_9FLAO|nr:polysaccharide biosynthesis protein [Aestuariibaculum lutulentum]MCH4553825.1 polysaccharide biosynthesis protein [Aestuariibaculum lutulentum]
MNYSIDYYIDQLINHTNIFDTNINNFNANKTFDFSEETILITGAAGTIGKELFNQLIKCSYKKIILVDIAESALHNLSIDFETQLTSSVVFKITNINDRASVEYLFKTYKPTIVFHCAAYKHVPLMETHPYEAIKTNILATKQISDFAINYNVKTFVFISSDKAVEPTSIMGMTKNISEQYLRQITPSSNIQFIITRFGNILGSNGSVLPVFLRQIELNSALTITDNSMTRYFIGKEKACQLILESTCLKNSKNNTLTFKTSQAVKILDLAKAIISISKRSDLKIEVSGVRSGEKMLETMIAESELLTPTNHPEIFQIEHKKKSTKQIVDFKSLENISPESSTQEIKSILKKLL